VKTSINIDDGVIDVDVPLPDFITSFESAVSSPSSSGYLSASGFGTGLDAFEQSFRFAAEGDVPLNVAGWLQCYHPDFVLQALPAQQDIPEQIKDSMRAEPTPALPPATTSSDGTPTEKWIDITSAIVADTTTFTITRIRYRRLVRLARNTPAPPPPPPAPTTPSTPATTATAATTPPSYETHLKEEFIEEPIVVFDDVLIEAVERVIAAAGTSTETTVSKVSSTSSSRSTSKRRERERRDSLSAAPAGAVAATAADGRCSSQGQGQGHGQSHHHQLVPVVGAAQEVPRSKCKTVLLSALEDIIQDVIVEREQEQEQEHEQGAAAAARERERERESPLREAVRAWIESLDLVGDSSHSWK
jgi:hypothetical protein